jgi:simple sugar transport system ATP-binding protein
MNDRTAHDGPVASDQPIVEAAHITKRYGATVALDDVGIRIRAGETHALVGRNGAGKSTLVNVLTGLQAPDAGTVRFDGAPAPALSDRDGWRHRVACVYQKSTIIPTLTVAENLFLNRHPRGRTRLVRWSTLRRDAATLLAQWGVEVDVNQPAASLDVEQRQFVEIARALSLGARFVILDEPTAQLDAAGISRLFARMRDLQRHGVTFLFISHHLQEIFQICDTVTVFRDARHILTAPVGDITSAALVTAMTGDEVDLSIGTREPVTAGTPPVLTVTDLVTATGAEVSFEVRAGEVVGLAGGGSSGKVGVAEAIVGLTRPVRGHVTVAGRDVPPGSVPAAVAAGVGLVPQDRHRQGFVPLLSIAENITMAAPGKFTRRGFISPQRRDAFARTMADNLAIKAPGPHVPVAGLSGGNQQKVVMGRALANDPKVLVLIGPTAGIDVRSKLTLLDVVEQVWRAGTGVLIVSDEIDDLRACHRVLVMFQGRLIGEMPAGWRDNDLVGAMEGLGFDHV